MSPTLVGRRLGPYRIASQIGAGGMGQVYKARDIRLNRTVAIKVLSAETAQDAGARVRFVREARAVAALNHPHICTLYDIGSEDGVDFLVMEYLEGETLSERMAKQTLAPDQSLEYALQIASALETAHRAGILHRDLKPGNVMLTTSGAKLLDFGLAKIDADIDATRTIDGTVLGTPEYMSPEQARGKPADARSDIFSFGAVLYEMLAGTRAFPGATTRQVIGALLRDDPLPLQRPSSAFDGVVRRCLAKPPEERFPTMSDVLAALQRVAVGPAGESPSIVVLPFANLSADPDNEYFSDGLAEEIINALAVIDGLHVAARTSSFSFKGKSPEIGDIASRLKVRHVLEGSVRKTGDRVRVTAQLVDATNGYQVWSERYDRRLADIFDVQDDIARSIVARLKVALDPAGPGRLVTATTNSIEAYQHYLKGRAMLYRRGPWIARALESFLRAVDLDPDYAQAWAGVADAYTTLCYSGYRRPDDTMPAALEAATRATVADPRSAEAHNALAIAALLWERDFDKSEREFLEALELNPKYMQARCWYALFFLQWGVGRYDQGLREAWRAVEADPLSGYATMVLSFALATVDRFDEAVAQARVAVHYDPDSFVARWQLGLACHWNRQHDEAIAILAPLWDESGQNWVPLALVPAYLATGREQPARAIYDALRSRRPREYVPPMVLGMCAWALGDRDAAIRFCEESVAEHDLLFGLFHRWLPDYAAIRADPRFPDIVTRFNSAPRPRA